ncbi:Ribonuclease H-like superfamily [Sesbania bispinosa]|nr:Ribonuclease H-like superfamily [Sesbania bispinosa]
MDSSFKLNVDGSFHVNSSMMGVGGLLRDSFGQWIGGFSSFEACGDCIFRGLEVARDLKLQDIICESDSEFVVQLILNLKLTNDLSYFQYVSRIKTLLPSFGSVVFQSVSRSFNIPAD